jgi:hypothetical protein
VKITDLEGISILDRAPNYFTLNLDSQYLFGSIRVYDTVNYSVTRNGEIIESGSQFATNYIGINFQTQLETGDQILVSSSNETFYDNRVAALTVQIDLVQDSIYGQTDPGRKILAVPILFTAYTNWYHSNHCLSLPLTQSCATAQAFGEFQLKPGVDIKVGDSFDFDLIDQDGNRQKKRIHSGPAIFVENSISRLIYGVWPQGVRYETQLQAFLRNSNGDLLWTFQEATLEENLTFSFDFPYDLAITAGDVFEVTDGTTSLFLSVPSIQLDPLHGSSVLSGSAPPGEITAYWYDYGRVVQEEICRESDVPGGRFEIPFTGETFSGMDQFFITHSDDQGSYYTFASLVMGIGLIKDQSAPWIYAPAERLVSQITFFHKRDGSLIGTYHPPVQSPGFANFQLPADTEIEAGDMLSMITDAGDEWELTVPELHGQVDSENGQIVGRASANGTVRAQVNREHNGTQFIGVWDTNADATGGFLISLPIDSILPSCRPFRMDRCTWFSLSDHTPEGNLIVWESPKPVAVTPDAFEPDETMQTASLYTEPQFHTITTNDTVDWLSIDVQPYEVGEPFTISTTNMGWDMELIVSYFRGTTYYTYDFFSEQGNQVALFWFDKPGISYIKIVPFSTQNYRPGSCDSAYTLVIRRPIVPKIYMPVVKR